jgi:hypothetical protein
MEAMEIIGRARADVDGTGLCTRQCLLFGNERSMSATVTGTKKGDYPIDVEKRKKVWKL